MAEQWWITTDALASGGKKVAGPYPDQEAALKARRLFERENHPQTFWVDSEEVASDLQRRLEAAERVCVLYGWTGGGSGSDREKALHELWSDWVDVSGVSLSQTDHPDLSDERIAELAQRRDATRAATLERMRARDADEQG
jgi:hypothetical protein